jgi:hypothetical protein
VKSAGNSSSRGTVRVTPSGVKSAGNSSSRVTPEAAARIAYEETMDSRKISSTKVEWIMHSRSLGLAAICCVALVQHTLSQTSDIDEKIVFTITSASIVQSARKNVVDKRRYESQDGIAVEFYSEIFRDSPEIASKYIDVVRDRWTDCSKYEPVLNPKNSLVGKRTIL